MTLYTLTGISSNLCYTDEKVRDLYINETPEDPLPVSVSPTQYTHSLVSALCQDLFFTPESDVFTLDDSHRDTLKSFFVLFVAADFIDLRTQQHNIWIFIPCLPLY